MNEDALELFQPGLVSETVTAGVGETSIHASKGAALDLATVLEDPGLWDGVQGSPNCTVTCNGGVSLALDAAPLTYSRLYVPCRVYLGA